MGTRLTALITPVCVYFAVTGSLQDSDLRSSLVVGTSLTTFTVRMCRLHWAVFNPRPTDTWLTLHMMFMVRINLPGRMPWLESNWSSSSPFWLSLALAQFEPLTYFAGRFRSYADRKLKGRRCCPPQRAFNHKTAQPHALLLAIAVVLNTGEAWRPTLTPIGE